MPEPITRLHFTWRGVLHAAEIAPNYVVYADETRAADILTRTIGRAGYNVVNAHVALKTLAVRSGLAEYGKNNLVYVPGMGSFLRLIAFYTDCPLPDDGWHEPRAMDACRGCSVCLKRCPNASIGSDRFLIRAENCLGHLNEMNPDVPYWVEKQPEWRNAFVGCMCCQSTCPANKAYVGRVAEGTVFSEDETALLLAGTPWDALPGDIQGKLGLGLYGGAYALLKANLRALIDRHNRVLRE